MYTPGGGGGGAPRDHFSQPPDAITITMKMVPQLLISAPVTTQCGDIATTPRLTNQRHTPLLVSRGTFKGDAEPLPTMTTTFCTVCRARVGNAPCGLKIEHFALFRLWVRVTPSPHNRWSTSAWRVKIDTPTLPFHFRYEPNRRQMLLL